MIYFEYNQVNYLKKYYYFLINYQISKVLLLPSVILLPIQKDLYYFLTFYDFHHNFHFHHFYHLKFNYFNIFELFLIKEAQIQIPLIHYFTIYLLNIHLDKDRYLNISHHSRQILLVWAFQI